MTGMRAACTSRTARLLWSAGTPLVTVLWQGHPTQGHPMAGTPRAGTFHAGTCRAGTSHGRDTPHRDTLRRDMQTRLPSHEAEVAAGDAVGLQLLRGLGGSVAGQQRPAPRRRRLLGQQVGDGAGRARTCGAKGSELGWGCDPGGEFLPKMLRPGVCVGYFLCNKDSPKLSAV